MIAVLVRRRWLARGSAAGFRLGVSAVCFRFGGSAAGSRFDVLVGA
jgi:hypothetical protein